ncbi:hypothetical protein AAMO2058_001454600 [Amorphochlora amoebiformis]
MVLLIAGLSANDSFFIHAHGEFFILDLITGNHPAIIERLFSNYKAIMAIFIWANSDRLSASGHSWDSLSPPAVLEDCNIVHTAQESSEIDYGFEVKRLGAVGHHERQQWVQWFRCELPHFMVRR